MQKTLVPVCMALLGACASSDEPAYPEGDPVEASRVNVQLAVGYMHRGDYELALEKLHKAVEQNPQNADAETTMGVLYETIGNPDEAREHYRKAVRLAPDDPKVRNNYGAYLCQAGRLKDAQKEFMAAVESPFYRTPEVALSNAGSCAARGGQPADAEGYFRRALDANPEYPDALYQMALLQFGEEEYLSARAFMQRYMEVARPSAASLGLAVKIEQAMGDEQAAEEYGRVLLVDFPDSPEARELAD